MYMAWALRMVSGLPVVVAPPTLLISFAAQDNGVRWNREWGTSPEKAREH